jgi:hypothetical protein
MPSANPADITIDSSAQCMQRKRGRTGFQTMANDSRRLTILNTRLDAT